jgi:methylated-DNA-[protein]-cysteine S-methyltransferase
VPLNWMNIFQVKEKNLNFGSGSRETEFQQKVWDGLLQIPYGKTISYLRLAQQLGNAKIIRAAASANGRNQLCIVVPCHRVIGSDGSLSGYGGGLHRKKWLLNHEAKFEDGVRTLF